MDNNVLKKLSYGMYVVCSKKDNRINGQISNTVFQVANEPLAIAVSISTKNLTHEFITSSGVFTASILSKETPMKFIGQFGFKSGRNFDKFRECKFKLGETGAPLIEDYCIGCLEAQVISSHNVGTHTVFIGKIVEGEVKKDLEPMTYEYYHEIKKGLSPENAPTYIKGM